MTRWMHPPELLRARKREQLDPVVEGRRYGLPRDLALAIWERVCADATDSAGRRDEGRARQQFHELAACIAARGGRLSPDVGRMTRVGVELDDAIPVASGTHELRSRTPGRETLVAVEARRWAHRHGEPAMTFDGAKEVNGSAKADEAMMRQDLPGAIEVAQAMAVLQMPARPDRAPPREKPVRNRMSRLFDFVPRSDAIVPGHTAMSSAALPATVMRSAERTEIDPEAAELVARARRGGVPLDAALREKLEVALGVRLDGVRVHTDPEAHAAARALGARAFALGEGVFFRDGAYDPQTRDGQWLIAHEVAHIVQTRDTAVSTSGAMTVSQPSDAAEHDADAFADGFADGMAARATAQWSNPSTAVRQKLTPVGVLAAASLPATSVVTTNVVHPPLLLHEQTREVQCKKDNERTVTRTDSPTVSLRDGKVFLTASSLPDIGLVIGATNALLAVNDDGKTLMPLDGTVEIGTFVGQKVLRVRPAALIKDKGDPTQYRYSFTGAVIGILADGTKILSSANGPPVAPDKLPAKIKGKLDADSVVRANASEHSWSYIIIASKKQWVTSKSVTDIRRTRALINSEYGKLPDTVKLHIEKYLPLIVAVATHEGKFNDRSSEGDPRASLGLFQWADERALNVGHDKTATLYRFFRALHDKAQEKVGSTAEQKLYINAWTICTDGGIRMRADGMLTWKGDLVTSGKLELIMYKLMAEGALRTYQLVAALDWIRIFQNRRIHPGTWSTTRARMGNGFGEPNKDKGDKAFFHQHKFKLNLVATNSATVGSVMTRVKNLSKVVILGANRPYYVEAAVWLAMMVGRDPKREAARLLAKLQYELENKFGKRPSFDESDVAKLHSRNAEAALTQLKELVWPKGGVDETVLLGRFQSAALDLYSAEHKKPPTLERARRFATVDALF